MRRGKEILWIRFASVEEKLEVMKRKRNLKDRKEWTGEENWIVNKKESE